MNEYILPITFGIDEQLITCGAVLSGFTILPQRKIIISLIIMALSNSLPDTLSYYNEKKGEGKDTNEALKLSSAVFAAEILSTLIILIPFFVFKDKNKAIASCYMLILFILLSSNYYRERNIIKSLSKLPIYIGIAFTIWKISEFARKHFKVTI